MSAGTLAPRLPATRIAAALTGALAALLAALLAIALLAATLIGGEGAAAPVEAASLDGWMAAEVPGSPLIGLGGVFVAAGSANGVDPRLLVAIARQESVLGTAGGGAAIHNAFGWGPHIPFDSWEENIATVARGLTTGYIGESRVTIAAIGAKWAPIGAANDPTGLNNHWVGAVSGFYAELGGDPARAVTLDAQALGFPLAVSAAGLAWPTPGVITSGFGPRWGRLHAGIDIAGPAGAPIGAAGAGLVRSVGWRGGYGNLVVIDHGGGLTTAYAHLQAAAVAPGQAIGAGAPVGAMGSTGNSTGVHLHFEVRVGERAVDPIGYLPARGLGAGG